MVASVAMASNAAATSNGIKLKLLVDMKSQKVVFAEAGKDFVDFLFNISYMPVGTMMKLLADYDSMGGCLTNIYQAIEKSSQTVMLPSLNKDDILNPKCVTFSASDLHTLSKFQTSTSSTFRVCKSGSSTCRAPSATNVTSNSCLNCHCSYAIGTVVEPFKIGTGVDNKGYVKGEWTYIVMDDLTVRLVSAISGVDVINGVNIKNAGILETRKVVSAMFGVDINFFIDIKNAVTLEAREVQLKDDDVRN